MVAASQVPRGTWIDTQSIFSQERDNSGSHRFCAKVQGERDEFVRGFVPEGEREAQWKWESDAEENVKPGYGAMSMTFMLDSMLARR